ncbi:hypothetical protein P154DRAFT_592938 [Amniculicola lignicola CBS 123094]|uniref:Uncharacterized protein n=1 Tax=Amniculicola lignicola CBS 123094 TaxID=1392246 RepID=A0A6A5X3N9_9PLEO|nr:hypothetical protein P154DRAFT_592938 [Amniculicola lignicola CBS 123094]
MYTKAFLAFSILSGFVASLPQYGNPPNPGYEVEPAGPGYQVASSLPAVPPGNDYEGSSSSVVQHPGHGAHASSSLPASSLGNGYEMTSPTSAEEQSMTSVPPVTEQSMPPGTGYDATSTPPGYEPSMVPSMGVPPYPTNHTGCPANPTSGYPSSGMVSAGSRSCSGLWAGVTLTPGSEPTPLEGYPSMVMSEVVPTQEPGTEPTPSEGYPGMPSEITPPGEPMPESTPSEGYPPAALSESVLSEESGPESTPSENYPPVTPTPGVLNNEPGPEPTPPEGLSGSEPVPEPSGSEIITGPGSEPMNTPADDCGPPQMETVYETVIVTSTETISIPSESTPTEALEGPPGLTETITSETSQMPYPVETPNDVTPISEYAPATSEVIEPPMSPEIPIEEPVTSEALPEETPTPSSTPPGYGGGY